MSGYPYGNAGGGYPSPYGMDNSGYQNYPPNSGFQSPPPPIPLINANQPGAYLYGTAAPSMPNNNNYSTPTYSASQMPGDSYGYGGGSAYPPPPPSGGQMPSPMFNQPSQQYGGIYESVIDAYI
jgi:hypothetical protein